MRKHGTMLQYSLERDGDVTVVRTRDAFLPLPQAARLAAQRLAGLAG